ncbi:hypothetical protein [Spiroplasma alleghenense]|uniref:Uncharacterized protein n=1 Tax=Spiroplasma alleghenense TaxID=216931 RepID=A0A345Z531_9MOLU|nr:hypothetical protein [Spiroplasma alleghenense]AXK51710.1 hypothetical protein SALLE_v1c10400 [Spiroplasma alleghenense]
MKLFSIIGGITIGISSPINLSKTINNKSYIINQKYDLNNYQESLSRERNNIISLNEEYKSGVFSENFKKLICYEIEDILLKQGHWQISGLFVKNFNDFDYVIRYEENYLNEYSKKMIITLIAKEENASFFAGTELDFWFINSFKRTKPFYTSSSLDISGYAWSNWSTVQKYDFESDEKFRIYFNDFSLDKDDFYKKYKGIEISYRATAKNIYGNSVLHNPYETKRVYSFNDLKNPNRGKKYFEIANKKTKGSNSYEIHMEIKAEIENNSIAVWNRAGGYVIGFGAPKKRIDVAIYTNYVKLV